jgi:hypothetical protein
VAFCFLWIFIPANMQGNEWSVSHDCPALQTGFVECKKDKFEILDKSAMKPLEDAYERLIQLCVLVV